MLRGASFFSALRRRGFPRKLLDIRIPRADLCTHDGPFDSSRLKIFDRDLKRKQRGRAAMHDKDSFVDAVAENLVDRLEDCRKTFPTALCLGGSLEAVRRSIHGHGGIEKLIMMDMSRDMVKLCRDAEAKAMDNSMETFFVVGDEEFLPIKER